jgi:PilZ domain
MIHPSTPVNESTPATPLPQSAERRAWIRYRRKLNVLWQLLGIGGTEVWPAKIQDISTTGIGLITNRPFRRGTILSIRFPRRDKEPHTHLARVKHVIPLAGDEVQVGCAFVVPLSDEELRSILA